MNYWWLFAIISGAGLASRNLLFKSASAKLDPALAALLLTVGMTLVSVVFYIVQRLIVQQPLLPNYLPLQASILCLLAGAGVAFANIFLVFAYKAGGYASLVALLQNGFSIIVTLALGYLLLAELVKPIQLVGVALIFVGIAMVTRA